MREAPFGKIRDLLDRYYDAVSYAQIDFEVETGLASEDGLRLIRRAVSHVAKHFERDDDSELNHAGRCLGEAVVTYRQGLYIVVGETAVELLRKAEGLRESAVGGEVAAIDDARLRIAEILKREKALENTDWEAMAGVYSNITREMEAISAELESLIIEMKTRRSQGG